MTVFLSTLYPSLHPRRMSLFHPGSTHERAHTHTHTHTHTRTELTLGAQRGARSKNAGQNGLIHSAGKQGQRKNMIVNQRVGDEFVGDETRYAKKLVYFLVQQKIQSMLDLTIWFSV